MHKKIVFDASALLVLLNQEPGWELAEQYLPGAILSTVNFSEVIAILLGLGLSDTQAEHLVGELIAEIIPFDIEQSIIAANFRKISKSYGLSLGDRACFALAEVKKLPVLTADKIWSKVNAKVEVVLVR